MLLTRRRYITSIDENGNEEFVDINQDINGMVAEKARIKAEKAAQLEREARENATKSEELISKKK